MTKKNQTPRMASAGEAAQIQKEEEKAASAALEFIKETARSFSQKEFIKCEKCGDQRKAITITSVREIGDHPILGYEWGNDARSIICPMNDYSYSWTEDALHSIYNYLQTSTAADLGGLMDALDNWDAGEFADGETSPYTADLLKWLGDNINNVEYMNDAINELGANDAFKMLTWAQYLAIQAHTENVRAAVHDYLQNKKKELEA